MNATTPLLIALVGLVATAGVAAAQPAGGASSASDQGPPDDLPGPVPDFVGDILDLIDQKPSGQELGESLSDHLGGDRGSESAGG